MLSEKAHACFQLSLAEFGEFLPISVLGFQYYIFNILRRSRVNEEESKYEYDDGIVVNIERLVCNDEDVENNAFFLMPIMDSVESTVMMVSKSHTRCSNWMELHFSDLMI